MFRGCLFQSFLGLLFACGIVNDTFYCAIRTQLNLESEVGDDRACMNIYSYFFYISGQSPHSSHNKIPRINTHH